MSPFDQQRRSLLVAFAGLGLDPLLSQLQTGAQPGAGYVLGPTQGEHLVHFRDGGDIFIKVGAAAGAGDLAMGTQQVMVGTGIPIHRHSRMDEAFYVLEGSGNVVLDDVRHNFARGASIFIPKNTWHGFENPRNELRLLWIVSPAGLDGFFRETCSPPAPRQGRSAETRFARLLAGMTRNSSDGLPMPAATLQRGLPLPSQVGPERQRGDERTQDEQLQIG